MNRYLTAQIMLIIVLISCGQGIAQTRELSFVGARPMAMGEAFVGVADDGNAVYWNPAGLCFINHLEVNSMYADLYGVGVKNTYLSMILPFQNRIMLGADWFRIRFKDDELAYSNNQFNIAFAYQIFDRFSIGTNIKYLKTRAELDRKFEEKGSGWGGDIGFLLNYSEKLKFGLVAYDFFGTRIKYKDGSSEKYRKRNIRVGASYRPLTDLLLAMDIDDRFHLGSEYLFLNRFAVRGGIQKDIQTSDDFIYSFGLGLNWQLISFDYSYTIYPALENTSRFSLRIILY